MHLMHVSLTEKEREKEREEKRRKKENMVCERRGGADRLGETLL